MRLLAVLVLVVATGCSCGASGAGTGGESTPFTAWSVPGLTLTRRCIAVPDSSQCHVVARTAEGAELDPRSFWARAARDSTLGADALAVRAIAILLGEEGSPPLGPSTDRSLWGTFVSDAEWAIVQAPSREDDWVVFDFVEGEMAPRAMRIRVHLPSGTIDRTHLAELVALRAAASGPAICAPALQCGCDRGCERFEPVPAVQGSARFRATFGEAPALYYRSSAGWMTPAMPEACDESCSEPATPPSYACALEGDACLQRAP